MAGQVHLQVARDEDGAFGLVAHAPGVPQRRADARHEFRDAERLRQVIVGAGIERGDLVALLPARGDDDDRHGAPRAQSVDHFEPVHVRQAEVQQHDIRPATRGQRQAFLPGRGLVERVAVAAERRPQEADDRRLVLDDQNARGVLGHEGQPVLVLVGVRPLVLVLVVVLGRS